ncbi:MAG: ATP-binding protein [Gemmatimonadaceae bacterium]
MAIRFRPSVRFRLTLWNSAILAAVLAVFAYGSYGGLVLELEKRADAAVTSSTSAIATAIVAERSAARARGEKPRPEMTTEALHQMRAGDLDVFIVDEASVVLAASRRRAQRVEPAPRGKAKGIDSVKKSMSITAGPDSLKLPDKVRELIGQADTSGVATLEKPLVRTLDLDTLGIRRAAVVRIKAGPNSEEPAMVVAALRSTEEDQKLLESVRKTFLFVIPVALLVSIALGYAIARRSLAPIEAMAKQAAIISAATLDERLPVVNEHDELGRLATVINDLLERVQGAFRLQRQFVADASHELRTPIAIVRGEADVTLQRPNRDEEEYREALVVIQDESVRLTRIVDDLFLLARTDAGAPVAVHKPLDLRELALGAVRSVRTIADDHDIVLEQELPDDPLIIQGDAPLLRRLLLNLLDNALKYTPRGGNVGIEMQREEHTVSIVVHDSGPGISKALRDRVFDRFVRAGPNERPPAHNDSPRASSGAGLGLAIAAAIAAAHHGTLTLDNNEGGARFRVTLPLAA